MLPELQVEADRLAERLARRARAAAAASLVWRPLPGPQTLALSSEADLILYGGAAGGGKTDLALGKGLTQHRRSLILRREYPQLKGIQERARELFGPVGSWNGKDSTWRVRHAGLTRVIEFGSCQYDTDKQKFQGRPHDLLVFDEAANFLEAQVQFLRGWVRTEHPNQRCQTLLCSNPPTSAEGEWLTRWFAPWLDPKHPRPARPGELRWFVMIDGKDREVDGPGIIEHKGERLAPQSRTFIPARITDNPYYIASGYVAQLQALPEPLRSKMLKGDFAAGSEDDRYQVIPSAWVRLAQERWRTREPPKTQQTCVGVDVARGGRDSTVLSPRYDNWFAEQIVEPGSATPNGPAVAQLVVAHRRDNALINVDIIGVGSAAYDSLVGLFDFAVIGLNASESSNRRDRSGRLGFANRRAEWWWGFREALDPASGEDLALPPDQALLADLCAPHWKLTARGIQVESKDDIIARLGRSPDRGDSAVYSLANHWMHDPLPPPPPKPGTAEYAAQQEALMEDAAEERFLRDQQPFGTDDEAWGVVLGDEDA